MASLLVRNLDKELLRRLKERAKRNRRSLQGEAKTILEEAAEGKPDFWMVAEEVREYFGKKQFPDSTRLIREDRKR